ncbi:glycoside hydrolase family 125 protein [Plebeiibacterium sediminum]|uniref:Glycoside hydrolase family 125 protein n=1 Tax=Plebeiibacterium sediminum TaxID=2992112 RepID=A0AAE3M6F5_9BACT|nr:glycoside hydrolase family 125 protein [Plebeiobacterium sediminum]MCW3787943.1 glycoside hydrolase family 125 protein [Plebeiobacterium sediminum]
MSNRRDFFKNSAIALAGMALLPKASLLGANNTSMYISKRPSIDKRKFSSEEVEKVITEAKSRIKDPKLAWMFENCFPNTLDTTVEYNLINGQPDTFVITGDIHAMWLRDSTAQVWPYLPLAKKDKQLRSLIAGVVFRQTKCVLIDPYANAFNKSIEEKSHWESDNTEMKKGVHERKWEIDSLAYTVRLAYYYWKTTGDTSVFNKDWEKAARIILKTFIEQQRKNGVGPYVFARKTDRQLDTLSNEGYGRPLKPIGLINSSFRPSDDASTYGFLIPSNLFAVESLKQLAEISSTVKGDVQFSGQCMELAKEINHAIQKYGIVKHPKYGQVYAFEVDGYGNHTFMDDANVPSLLSMPYLGLIGPKDNVYKNTRELIWSDSNPYFFKGKFGEGIGGPHIGYDMIWPMSIIMKAMTSTSDTEIRWCIKTLRDSDADTGFMHETFHKDNPQKFTRSWFAWANTLFGELVLKLINENKEHLLV